MADSLEALERYWNCRVTARGRKSGEPRQVTVWFALGAGVIYLTGGAEDPHWCRNIAAHPEVSLEIGPHRLAGRARIIEEGPEALKIRDLFVKRYLLARLARVWGGYTRSIPVEVRVETDNSNSKP